ncbi:MAG: tetratricopeptide repeat protein [Archangiaceae bacterium]|nr:tetratricopeptide repeat protein [Archangiaceae bacterium]
MINLGISLAVAAVVFVAVRLFGFPVYAGAIPATLAFIGVFVVLGRRTFTQLQTLMAAVQAELQSMPPNAKERKVRVDKVIKMLENALPLGKWQFLVEGQIYGQIGMLKYLFEDYDGAKAAFVKSNPRDHYVKAMEGALAYKKKDFSSMEKAFEAAVTHGKKESLMWAIYAWCLLQNKEKDKALKVLGRGVEQNPSDEKLKTALTALQNDKRLKMSPWEPAWWQFHLEPPPVQQQVMFQGGRRARYR